MDLQNTGNVARVEIVNAIKEAGITPNQTDLTQLSKAITSIVEKVVSKKLPSFDGVPNLEVGKETKWNMLYKGKQVYAQLFDFGVLGHGEKHVKHNIPDIDWVQLHYGLSVAFNKTDTVKMVHPIVVSVNTPAANWFAAVSADTVYFRTGQNRHEFEAIVCILYTKKSDKVIE